MPSSDLENNFFLLLINICLFLFYFISAFLQEFMETPEFDWRSFLFNFLSKYLPQWPFFKGRMLLIELKDPHPISTAFLNIWKDIEYTIRELGLFTSEGMDIFLSIETLYFFLCLLFLSISILILGGSKTAYNFKKYSLEVFKISLYFSVFILSLVTCLYILKLKAFVSISLFDLIIPYFTGPEASPTFYHQTINSSPILFIKCLICICASILLVATNRLLKVDSDLPFGFLYVFLLYVGCLLVLLSATDFLLFYVLLEFISLASYLLLALYRDNSAPLLVIEAAIKYLIMGSFTTAFFLLGTSFMYLTTGSLVFTDLFILLRYFNFQTSPDHLYTLYFSMFLVLSIIFFKLAAAPFHTWSIDVYTVSSFFVFCVFMILPKLSLSFILVALTNAFSPYFGAISIIFYTLGGISILIGLLGGMFQNNLQRLFAYSAVVNVGFYLVSLSLNTPWTNALSILFIIIYAITNLSFFVTIIPHLTTGSTTILVNTFFKKYSFTNPILFIFAIVALFSLAGLPPLLGFWGKMFVIFAIVQQKLFLTALFLLVATSALTFFYINIIREISFTETKYWSFTPKLNVSLSHVLTFLFFINILGFCCFFSL